VKENWCRNTGVDRRFRVPHSFGVRYKKQHPGGHDMKTETVKKLAVVALVTLVAACNTVQGAGKDVESIGKAGERTLDKAKEGL